LRKLLIKIEAKKLLTVYNYSDGSVFCKITKENIDDEKSISFFKNKEKEKEHKRLYETILEEENRKKTQAIQKLEAEKNSKIRELNTEHQKKLVNLGKE
jgi:hypothetical protein